MIGRLIEDAYVLGRFVWFYSQAPKRMNESVGFARSSYSPTMKARVKWAWLKTSRQI